MTKISDFEFVNKVKVKIGGSKHSKWPVNRDNQIGKVEHYYHNIITQKLYALVIRFKDGEIGAFYIKDLEIVK